MLNAINRLNKLKEAMFKERKTPCSFNKTVYEKDKDSFNCQGSTNVYHCIPNERNRSGEICIQSVWVQPSKNSIITTWYIISHFILINVIVHGGIALHLFS